ncbi:efflux RND transporter permease subunit [Paenisporosarcina cavernae]|uniref:Efflux RND transporter permease subunit n=1 Tax=Paenisporosarcina cavernae TaxID=2320858 RepID=A0A385YP91_9BACL|nr:efflux RND transporter permease subunit [Paenisporosarcina cavernae]AYC28505.1 efflux RND transporter permease subunit [Paenisporosarcina cavernae]
MNSIVRFVLKNKLAVWLITIIVTISGLYSATQMKMETIPDISIPYLTVMTVYPGATPEKVMDDLSIPIEKKVESMEGVKAVFSNSYANMSSVQLEFEYEVDMDEAKREVQSLIDQVTFPEQAQDPIITRISMNMMPVIALSVSSSKEDIVSLTSLVEDVVVPKIEKIDGVSSVAVSGQNIEEVELTYDEEALAKYNVTKESIAQMIQASDMDVSLGLFQFDDAEEAVSVDGKLTTVDQLNDLLIPVTPSETQPLPMVNLGELASIELVGKVESVSRTNGEEAIAIQIVKAQDANTVTVVNEVKDVVKELGKTHPELTIDTTLDQGKPIEDSVETMISKALFGAGFAVLIILLFLRDFRSTIISIVSIPVSILMAILILKWMDITLNIMTLGAITVAIGRVIDDSIVVVENIYRRIHLKEERLTGGPLVRAATIEMFKPILSSTLVTVAVFAPLIFVGGMVGELFTPFALTMTFALGASLLVAITIVPAMSHLLFRKKLATTKQPNQHKEQGKLSNGYKKGLAWTLRHKVVTLLLAFVLFGSSLALAPIIGFSFLGSEEEKMMYLTYTPAPGELKEDMLENVEVVEQKMMDRKDVDIVQVSVSDKADPMAAMAGGGSNGALLFVIFDEDTKNFQDVKAEVEESLKNMDQSGEWKSQNFAAGGMAGNELSYTIYGDDLSKVEKAVDEIEAAMSKSDKVKDVTTSLSDRFTEHSLETDQQTLLQYGLTTGQLAMLLNPMQQEEVLTTIERDDTTIDVIVKAEDKSVDSFDALLDTEIPTAMGTTVPLKDIVEVEEGSASSTLDRSKGQFYASVSGTITSKDITKASEDVDKKVDAIDLPNGVEIGVDGVTADMQETFTQLGLAMLAAIAIVYFILVVTFSEGVAPFAILFSLPFTVIGAFVGLWIAGETISVSVMMGLLMLIGIVVTNAIVLVDRIIHMERDGMTMREAVLEAGATRIRPILMTAIATIGALLPLAFGSEGSGLISKALGVTVIGGLASSTLLTLFIVPIVYEILSKLFKKNRAKAATREY